MSTQAISRMPGNGFLCAAFGAVLCLLVAAGIPDAAISQSRPQGRAARPSGAPPATARAPVHRLPASRLENHPRVSMRTRPMPVFRLQDTRRQTFLPRTAPRQAQPAYRDILTTIERGMVSGDVSSFSAHMGSQVFVRLRGQEGGLYSSNQAYYLLRQFLQSWKITSFRFSTVGESDSNPYAAGSASLTVKGSPEYAQVYVSLTRAGDRWVISQINVY